MKERLRHEVVGILLVALGIFIFLGLVSYAPMDPSFFSYTSSKVREIHNWMGIVGAYASSLLFQGFGFSSFLIPFVVIVFAISFILRWEWKYISSETGRLVGDPPNYFVPLKPVVENAPSGFPGGGVHRRDDFEEPRAIF